MDNLRTVATISDGKNCCDYGGSVPERAVSSTLSAHVLSLSFGIGERDVDHAAMESVARATGGRHLVVRGSGDLAREVARQTEFILAIASRRTVVHLGADGARVHQSVVTQASVARLAVDLVILIDRSWSMFGMGADQSSDTPRERWTGDPLKMPRAQEAAVQLIRSLNPQYDRVGISQFCEEYKCVQHLTHDFDSCVLAVRSIRGCSCSSLWAAMAKAAAEFCMA